MDYDDSGSEENNSIIIGGLPGGPRTALAISEVDDLPKALWAVNLPPSVFVQGPDRVKKSF